MVFTGVPGRVGGAFRDQPVLPSHFTGEDTEAQRGTETYPWPKGELPIAATENLGLLCSPRGHLREVMSRPGPVTVTDGHLKPQKSQPTSLHIPGPERLQRMSEGCGCVQVPLQMNNPPVTAQTRESLDVATRASRKGP